MKKNFSLLLLIFVPFTLLYSEGQTESESPDGPRIATRIIPMLEYAEGNVRINGEEAELGQDVPFGATVQTGEDSYGEITIGTGNIFRIQSNSVAILELDDDSLEINLRFGAVGAVFDKIDSVVKGGSARVATPTAVAGVRGTAFFVNAEDLETTYICTCNGTLHITDKNGEAEQIVESGHHTAFRFARDDDTYAIESSVLIYHDDGYMERLAESVEVSIDWVDR